MNDKLQVSDLDFSDSHFLLGLSALFEDRFSLDWVTELGGIKPSIVLQVLEKAAKDGSLVRYGPAVFGFSKAKTRESYKSDHLRQYSVDPQEIHRRIADILIRDLPDNEAKAITVAYHLMQTVNNADMSSWLIRAGDVYINESRTEKALQCFTKVLDDLSSITGSREDAIYAETAIKYSKVSTARYNTKKILRILHEAIIRAKKWNLTSFLALLHMHVAKNEWIRSRYAKALEYFETGWSIAREMKEPKLERSAITLSTFFFYWLGRFQDVIENYEKYKSDSDKYPKGRFPLIAEITSAYCYAVSGRVNEGLRMLHSILKDCEDRKDLFMASYAAGNTGIILLDVLELEGAIEYLKRSIKYAQRGHNRYANIMDSLALAYAYYLQKDTVQSISYLKEFLRQSEKVHATVRPYSYLFSLCWAMKQGKLPELQNVSLEKEINSMIKSKNMFAKGVALRYKALLQLHEGSPKEKAINCLIQSIECLQESGHQIEIANSHIELARQYIKFDDIDNAKQESLIAKDILVRFNENLIPDEIRSIGETPKLNEKIFKNTLELASGLVNMSDKHNLNNYIIAYSNRIVGAERGAIFILEKNKDGSKLELIASKNLSVEDLNLSNFSYSLEIIKGVILSGNVFFTDQDTTVNENIHQDQRPRSCICVPIKLEGNVFGCLYHDNRFIKNAFSEYHLNILTYFACLSAMILDNIHINEELQKIKERYGKVNTISPDLSSENEALGYIIGNSIAIKDVCRQVRQVAGTDTSVLIFGETGVGKELVARATHSLSLRKDKPLIKVFCSALPETLMSSELFGHEKGAFTDATQRRIGRFELADEGTILLDEIGDLPLEVQVRLLRILETREFERLGSSQTLYSDFRLICATNRELEEQVKTGRFRKDLFYRLNVFPIHVPPLRDRKEDIPLLAKHYLEMYSTKVGKFFESISDQEMNKLIQHTWPGNVRELKHVIESSVLLSLEPHFKVTEMLSTQLASRPSTDFPTLEESQRDLIISALNKTGWKVRGAGGAAELLEIHPSTLHFRIKKLGIQKPSKYSRVKSSQQTYARRNIN